MLQRKGGVKGSEAIIVGGMAFLVWVVYYDKEKVCVSQSIFLC